MLILFQSLLDIARVGLLLLAANFGIWWGVHTPFLQQVYIETGVVRHIQEAAIDLQTSIITLARYIEEEEQ